MERALTASRILMQLIEPNPKDRSIVQGRLVYDDQDMPYSRTQIVSDQVYRIGSYLSERIDLIFYDDGQITVYFVVDGEPWKHIQVFDTLSELYELSEEILLFFGEPPSTYDPIIKQLGDYRQKLPKYIRYGKFYTDDCFEYRIVQLSRKAYSKMRRNRILSTYEWGVLGILQDPAWNHIFSYQEDQFLVFRR